MEKEQPGILGLFNELVEEPLSIYETSFPIPDEVKIRIPKDVYYKLGVYMKENSYSLKTTREYCTYVKRMIGDTNYISEFKIRKFLSKKNGLMKRSSVKLLIQFLDDIYNIQVPPFRYPRFTRKKKPISVLTRDEVNKLIEAMREEFKLFTKVMYFGGLRVSETVKIRNEDFNWEKWAENTDDFGELRIFKGKRNKERIIPLNPELMKEIYEFIPKHENGALNVGLLFDVSMATHGIRSQSINYDLYVQRKKKAGYPPDVIEVRYVEKVKRFYTECLHKASQEALGKIVRTHSLRSSRATILDESGVRPTIIQSLLGHDNLSTTSRYIFNTPQKVKAEISKVKDYDKQSSTSDTQLNTENN